MKNVNTKRSNLYKQISQVLFSGSNPVTIGSKTKSIPRWKIHRCAVDFATSHAGCNIQLMMSSRYFLGKYPVWLIYKYSNLTDRFYSVHTCLCQVFPDLSIISNKFQKTVGPLGSVDTPAGITLAAGVPSASNPVAHT